MEMRLVADTSVVFQDRAAYSPMRDHPLRWVAFALHPIGVVLDYGINRPLYAIASTAPELFGYTKVDAALEAQAYSGRSLKSR